MLVTQMHLRLVNQHDKEHPSNAQRKWPERAFCLTPLLDKDEIGIAYSQGTIYNK